MNMSPTKPRLLAKSSSLALILAAAFWQPAIYAQTANDEVPPEEKKDEVIKLETLEVRTEVGHYHEQTSGTASKVPMDIKEVAGSLQILNSNALMDRNAVTLQDVYTYIV